MKVNKKYHYKTLKQLAQLIPKIWEDIDSPIILLSGNLGAGKTALVQEIGKYLGFQDVVNSPTFTLINEYLSDSGKQYYHMDMYRLKNIQEAIDLGIEEYLYGQDICFIEWPELIFDILPPKFVHLKIEHNLDGRDLEIIKYG